MSLVEYVIQKLEARINAVERKHKERLDEIEGRLEVVEDRYVDIDYLKSVVEKAYPEAASEGWWDDIFA